MCHGKHFCASRKYLCVSHFITQFAICVNLCPLSLPCNTLGFRLTTLAVISSGLWLNYFGASHILFIPLGFAFSNWVSTHLQGYTLRFRPYHCALRSTLLVLLYIPRVEFLLRCAIAYPKKRCIWLVIYGELTPSLLWALPPLLLIILHRISTSQFAPSFSRTIG